MGDVETAPLRGRICLNTRLRSGSWAVGASLAGSERNIRTGSELRRSGNGSTLGGLLAMPARRDFARLGPGANRRRGSSEPQSVSGGV